MNLRVTPVQTNLYWENPTANLAMLEEKLMGLTNQTDVLILPEMFTTGFTMQPQSLAEPMNLTTTRWLRQMATQTKAVVTGSFIVKESGNYYNRLVWMQPDGAYYQYDKRHLFRMGGEHEVYTAGNQKLIVEWKGWKICPLICYDLRFPVWSRNIHQEYDVLIYVANWPAVREYPWKSLLTARAIENQSYVIGVNRVGNDGHGVAHTGASGVIDFKGVWLNSPQNAEVIHTFTLDSTELSTFRTHFPASLDADSFEIQ
ncbi:MAG: amidohydrolase [Siphonobacter sp.]